MKKLNLFLLVVAVGALSFAAACGDDDDDDDDDAMNEVEVTLSEFAIDLSSGSADAGDITFVVTNDGPDDQHEFVIFKTDLAPDALPTAELGFVEENGEGVELIDEIEEFPVGETMTETFNLEPGKYVFICNLLEQEDNGEYEAHYAEGMRIAFEVN